MAIIIKEIQVKATVQQNKQKEVANQLTHLKKEIMRELKDYLHREHIRKYER